LSNLSHVANIVSAYLSNNAISHAELPRLMKTVHDALANLGQEPVPAVIEPQAPAVPIKKSITPDYLICLEDGRKMKSLKRHLMTSFNLTPDQYRVKWGLPKDYPMVAPNYAAVRSAMAKRIGLGQTSKTPKAK
jgi:predicted transcriptional regulator